MSLTRFKQAEELLLVCFYNITLRNYLKNFANWIPVYTSLNSISPVPVKSYNSLWFYRLNVILILAWILKFIKNIFKENFYIV